MVDDPGQASPLEVLPVGERSQHVDMPDPVHVQGREKLQVSLWLTTLLGYQAHPTLLVPDINISSLSTHLRYILPSDCLPHNIFL